MGPGWAATGARMKGGLTRDGRPDLQLRLGSTAAACAETYGRLNVAPIPKLQSDVGALELVKTQPIDCKVVFSGIILYYYIFLVFNG